MFCIVSAKNENIILQGITFIIKAIISLMFIES